MYNTTSQPPFCLRKKKHLLKNLFVFCEALFLVCSLLPFRGRCSKQPRNLMLYRRARLKPSLKH